MFAFLFSAVLERQGIPFKNLLQKFKKKTVSVSLRTCLLVLSNSRNLNVDKLGLKKTRLLVMLLVVMVLQYQQLILRLFRHTTTTVRHCWLRINVAMLSNVLKKANHVILMTFSLFRFRHYNSGLYLFLQHLHAWISYGISGCNKAPYKCLLDDHFQRFIKIYTLQMVMFAPCGLFVLTLNGVIQY